MKRLILFAVAILAIVVGFLLVSTAQASGAYPEGVQVFEVKDHTCVLSPVGLECFCPCASCVVPAPLEQPTTCQEDEPCWNCETMGNGICGDEPTDEPKDTPTPSTDTPPTDKPTVGPTEEPRHHCNKGGGNGSEGCDPGNNPEHGHDDE